MQPIELERYLHEHIPLTRAMAVTVKSLEATGVLLAAPLAPNINHRDTVFGGSAAALAILAGWALLHVRLAAEGRPARLVIQRNTMEYVRPIAGDFTARAALVAEPHWSRFTNTLERRGRARVTVLALLEHAAEDVGHFSGEFVALSA
ncbi:MAG TPA: YiiD C-terminal domain-containing protein [Candidatus Dormibacteraeota bacterium]|nr:YiiD C-terminal domain-containing protein [Candidatus Dormibacteraeota bacterium]